MTRAAWSDMLETPRPGQHIAQLYTDPAFLGRAAGRYIADGLVRGEGAIVIATPLNWSLLRRRLEHEGLALDEVRERGQLAVHDASETLGLLLVDGMPDRERVHSVIGSAIEAMKAADYPTIRAFGEMVDILRHRSLRATIRLEELWNEILAVHGISLLCGYSADPFEPQAYRGLVQGVCATHSDLMPVEDYERLTTAVERAYTDVFGSGGDPEILRRTLLEVWVNGTSMPQAQAAILAVHDLVPATAQILLERVAAHYRDAR